MAQNYTAEQIDLLKQSLKYVALSQDVYNTGSQKAPDGWKIVTSSSLSGQWSGGFYARIYEREGPLAPGEPKYVVAFRGTDSIRDKQNLDADLQIIFRKLPLQHHKGVDFVKDFCEKNNVKPADIGFTGHSLGGYLAITIGMTLGVHKMWVFNSPGPTKAIRDELSSKIPGISKPPCRGLVQVRSSYDVIARWQYQEGRIVEVETAGGNHSLGNLQKAIETAVTGQPQQHTPTKGSIATVFNELSKRLTQSGKVSNILDKLFGRGGHQPPDCDC